RRGGARAGSGTGGRERQAEQRAGSRIPHSAIRDPHCHGNNGGGTRFLVACSNAYASSISFGSLHAIPVKLTPNGAGLALNPPGNAGVGALGNIAKGTINRGQ